MARAASPGAATNWTQMAKDREKSLPYDNLMKFVEKEWSKGDYANCSKTCAKAMHLMKDYFIPKTPHEVKKFIIIMEGLGHDQPERLRRCTICIYRAYRNREIKNRGSYEYPDIPDNFSKDSDVPNTSPKKAPPAYRRPSASPKAAPKPERRANFDGILPAFQELCREISRHLQRESTRKQSFNLFANLFSTAGFYNSYFTARLYARSHLRSFKETFSTVPKPSQIIVTDIYVPTDQFLIEELFPKLGWNDKNFLHNLSQSSKESTDVMVEFAVSHFAQTNLNLSRTKTTSMRTVTQDGYTIRPNGNFHTIITKVRDEDGGIVEIDTILPRFAK
ncbi:MAG: hypothetical protein ACMG6E_07335, partial [Candidatus Roizmanbacteria bacterium]